MVAFTTRMPVGIPGALSRGEGQATIEAGIYNSSAAFAAYGLPGKLSSGKFVPVTAAADVVAGILLRPYPTHGANASDPLGTAVPPTTGICNILRRGYIAVVSAGTPAKGGQVYLDATTAAITAVSTSNTALTGAKFTGSADANGVVEIEYNL